MEPVVKAGKTVDDAIDAALEELNLSRDEVQVDILQIESAGVLGFFGKRDGKVRVTPLKGLSDADFERKRKPARPKGGRPRRTAAGAKEQKPPPKREPRRPAKSETVSAGKAEDDVSPQAAEILEKISECFGIEVEVTAEETENQVNLRVVGEDVGQLIGRRGKTLGAVQYMVSRLINEDRPQKMKVSIDVDGYNEDREQSLRELARRTRERVIQTNRPYSLRPMSPQERRIIHVALQNDRSVATESFGEEGNRCVILHPKNISEGELEKYLRSMERGSRRGPRQRRGGRRN